MLITTLFTALLTVALGSVIPQAVLRDATPSNLGRNVSTELFNELEELARLVDISYCVGATGLGIKKPFKCASRCSDFQGFELVTTWSTGQLLSDSCGYIALSHPPSPPRIIVAFRGTYSMANTIADLSTIPQDYVPYPDDGDDKTRSQTHAFRRNINPSTAECTNCTVHMGFMRSWQHTKAEILPHVKELIEKYPHYQLTLVGHSLGGAVAALASLDFQARGWHPKVTTFGEPKIGNQNLVAYLDKAFEVGPDNMAGAFRRVTHADDPVPLLPLTEWGYRPHGGEIYISKAELPPTPEDLRQCEGDADPKCLAGAEDTSDLVNFLLSEHIQSVDQFWDVWKNEENSMTFPARWKLWQLFFAHRDYFWRIGLCVPWSDPKDWFGDSFGGQSKPTEL